MNKNSIIDYSGYILVKLFGPLVRSLPLGFGLFLGRRIGDLLYYFDLKHKTIAYANIKTAFANKLSPSQLLNLTRKFYQALGQNFMEVLFIPLITKEYINRYVTFEGLDYIPKRLHRGKGVIFLGIHAGNWELTNIICSNLGFPFILLVRNQRYPRLDRLLNYYRIQKGCKVTRRQNGIQDLIQTLKENGTVVMTVDQGGRDGMQVKFFGKGASMAYGAVKLALKYDATIILSFSARIKGPEVKVIVQPPFELQKTGNLEQDISFNLQAIVSRIESHIEQYPQEYLWTYRIWKYSRERYILILSDTKTGHLRQAQAVADIVSNYLKDKGIKSTVNIAEIKFKNKFAKTAVAASSCLAGKYRCQSCLWCLRTFLKEDVYKTIINFKPDIVISCGSSIAPVNYVISRENLAKSIVIMRPSVLSARRFDLVIMPKHDSVSKRRNVVITEGALNLIDEEYLRGQSERLLQSTEYRVQSTGLCIGLLIGGNTRKFSLKKNIILEVIQQIKSAAEKLSSDILVTTSRRTSGDIEKLLKEEFQNYPRCKLLIIANEKNIPEAVGGILGLSQIVIASSESISMISEAASSKKYVLVFNSPGLSNKHQRFLEYFVKNQYIYLIEASELSKVIEDIWLQKPKINTLKDNLLVREAIKRIL